jgi:hypothetical protein
VVLERAGEQLLALLAAPQGVAPERPEPLRQRARVAQRHAALLADELGHTAAARGRHRHPGAHRLQHRERRELVAARAEHERGGAPEQRWHVDARHAAEQLDGSFQAVDERRQLGGGRSLAGDPERHARQRRRLDREVEPLLGRQPPGGENVSALVRPRAPGQLLRGHEVGEHVEPVARHPEFRELTRRPAARRDEAIGGGKRQRLV